MSDVTTDTLQPVTRSLQFVEPLPGFDDDASFTLAPIDSHGLLFSMRSERDPQLRFVLTPADNFFTDYHPELPPLVLESIGADAADEVEVLLVLTITAGLLDATANLRAPVVVASATGQAVQVVLDDDTLPMRRPLVDAQHDG